MEGTGSPISFQSYACRVCQVGGQLPSGVPCLSTIGSMDDDVSCGSSQSHRCELLRRWGSCVIVGKCRKGVAPNNTGVALSGKSCFRDVLIGRSSLAGNPFVGAPRVRLCKAYDELLRLLLSNDLDYDRLALTFPHLVDDPGSGVAGTTSFEKRILVEVASSHHVQLHDSYVMRAVSALRRFVHGWRIMLGSFALGSRFVCCAIAFRVQLALGVAMDRGWQAPSPGWRFVTPSSMQPR